VDIRIRVDLFEHKKWLRLCKAVGRGDAVGLFQLWAWCAIFRSRGDLADRTDDQIAAAAGIPADRADAFLAALRDSSDGLSPWLDPDNTLHDWKEEQAYAYHLEERRERGRQDAHKRWGDRLKIPRTALARVDPIVPAKPSAPQPSAPARHKKETQPGLEAKATDAVVLLLATKSVSFNATWKSYLAMRQRTRKPATAHAQKLVLDKVEQLAPAAEATQIAILEQSIVGSWTDVYRLKDAAGGNPMTAYPRLEPKD
jgi:hypothetical protein